ncbi:MAG TPA: cytochrome c [Nitrospiria bacterium]|nr:cytochrome c [Nitrospiria bacterium]
MSYPKVILPVAAGVILTITVTACSLFEDQHVARGHELFAYYCSHCHGPKGQGNGYNAGNMDPRPRDLTDRAEPYMAGLSNDDIFRSIREGVAGAFPEAQKAAAAGGKEAQKKTEDEEGGSPLMPYWGYTFSEDEIWDLVAYVRTLHKNTAEKIVFKDEAGAASKKPALTKPQAPAFPEPGSSEGVKLAEEGKHLYETKYSCSGCHRINGKGGQVGPDLSRAGFRLNAKWIYQWIQYPQAFRSNTKMPAFNMPEADVEAIVMYLKTLHATSAESPGPPFGKGPM